jgi:AraC family transcriptional regulator
MKQNSSKISSNSYINDEYKSRINNVIDYIEENIKSEMSLKKLAEVANFSNFHFHRIFKTMMGETLNQFIQRIRIEKAAMLLINNPKFSITDISYECGFSSPSVFARLFLQYYEMSATEWRSGGFDLYSKKSKIKSKNCQSESNKREEIKISSNYFDSLNQKQFWRIKMKETKEVKVEVRDLPDFHVAYIRHIGPYQGDGQLFGRLFGKLCQWAGPRGLLNFPETKMLSIYHDPPEITDDEKLRLSVSISVPKDTEVDGEVGKMKIAGGKYAVANFELAEDEYSKAWETIYGKWLPQSGYQPDDKPCYELYLNDPETHPEKKCIVDIHVPVKPL